MLEVKALSVRYQSDDPRLALSDISFSLKPQERLALTGNNGAGKSTLFLTLVGILLPESGSIAFNGMELTRATVEAFRKRIGLVMQNPDDQLFMPTVYEDAAFGLRNRKVDESAIQEKVDAVLSALGIPHLKERFTHRLSGGEKRLAALAGVLVMEPDILLLDEPAAFLDKPGRQRLIEILSVLPQAIILASHDTDMAECLCNRVLHLEQGRKKM